MTVVARSTAGSKTYLSDSSSNESLDFGAFSGAHEKLKGGEKTMTFSEWIEVARANWKREEGQTMAEYGVVLAVITIGAVAVFGLLSGGITGAINKVIGLLPK